MEINHALQKERYPGSAERGEGQLSIIERREKENSLLNESEGFYMTVNCEIMQEAGIIKGDTILVNRKTIPLNGNVVVANISGDVVIRFYQKIQAKIFLSGDAGKVGPMQIEPGFEDFEILGVVTYVVKRV